MFIFLARTIKPLVQWQHCYGSTFQTLFLLMVHFLLIILTVNSLMVLVLLPPPTQHSKSAAVIPGTPVKEPSHVTSLAMFLPRLTDAPLSFLSMPLFTLSLLCRSTLRPWCEPALWSSTSERLLVSELGTWLTTPTPCCPRTKRSLPCSRGAEIWRHGSAAPRYVYQQCSEVTRLRFTCS